MGTDVKKMGLSLYFSATAPWYFEPIGEDCLFGHDCVRTGEEIGNVGLGKHCRIILDVGHLCVRYNTAVQKFSHKLQEERNVFFSRFICIDRNSIFSPVFDLCLKVKIHKTIYGNFTFICSLRSIERII